MSDGWRCTSCGTFSGANDQRCASCGGPRLRGTASSSDSNGSRVDAWRCTACETVNATQAWLCTACGSERPEHSDLIADVVPLSATTIIDRHAGTGPTAEAPGSGVPMRVTAEDSSYPKSKEATGAMDAAAVPSRSIRMPMVLAGVLIAGISLAVGLVVGLRSSRTPGASSSAPESSAPSSADSTQQGPSGLSGSSAGSDVTATSATTTTTLAPGLTTVDTSAMAPGGINSQVGLTFSMYFGGIDDRAWDQMYSAYSTSFQQNNGEAGFVSSLATTTDSGPAVTSISQQSDGTVLAHVLFTSRQDARYGPNADAFGNGDTCDHWAIDYRLVSETASLAHAPDGTPLTYYIGGTESDSVQAC